VFLHSAQVEALLELKLPIKLHGPGIVVGTGECPKVWIVEIGVHLELVTAEDMTVE
jgi:hypothetical protein